MRTIEVKVKRSTAEGGSSWQTYQVAVPKDRMVSVLNILEEIYDNHDHTLAFFSHATCRQSACGKCTVKVNGKNRLACKELVQEDQLTLEPYTTRVVRDLLCQ